MKYAKVKIKSCEKKSFWYSNNIGQEFWVEPCDERSYHVIPPSIGSLIRKNDSDIIELFN
jgi:hypothetical protein